MISYSTIIRSSNIFFIVTQNMHKSVRRVFTFGLWSSTLVMLSVMPLLNNNTVAMAQN
jgi:hypothetical protein